MSGYTGSPGVTVVAAGGNSAVSDGTGAYTISGLIAGSYSVTASKAGCLVTPPSLSVSVGPSVTGKNFTTSCSFSISGSTGAPGVTVTGGGRSAVSDTNGNYSIANLSAATYSLAATKAGCVVTPSALSVSVGPSATGKNFTTTCGTPNWQISNPGLPGGIDINAGWARNQTDAYIIGTRTAPKSSLPEAFLYKWNGSVGTQAFYLANASALSVFGTGKSEVWLSAYYAPGGPSVIYRSIVSFR